MADTEDATSQPSKSSEKGRRKASRKGKGKRSKAAAGGSLFASSPPGRSQSPPSKPSGGRRTASSLPPRTIRPAAASIFFGAAAFFFAGTASGSPAASARHRSRSGQSELAFARARGYSSQRLRYWKRQLGGSTNAPRVRSAPAKTTPAFVAVAMPVAARAPAKIEIHAGGLSVCVREDLDVEHLARIVDALARVLEC